MNDTLAELKLQKHPDKPFIGRVSRGFDFLGYQFTPAGLEVAPRAVERCVERVSRLYEQGADLIRIETYVRRWQRWARSGLRSLGEELANRALEVVGRSCYRFGFWRLPVPPLIPAAARQSVGDSNCRSEPRHRES